MNMIIPNILAMRNIVINGMEELQNALTKLIFFSASTVKGQNYHTHVYKVMFLWVIFPETNIPPKHNLADKMLLIHKERNMHFLRKDADNFPASSQR